MLNTEKRNPRTYNIDKMSTGDMLKIINDENSNVISAIDKALPEIEKTCDAVSQVIMNGGRVFIWEAGPRADLPCAMLQNVRRPSACHTTFSTV